MLLVFIEAGGREGGRKEEGEGETEKEGEGRGPDDHHKSCRNCLWEGDRRDERGIVTFVHIDPIFSNCIRVTDGFLKGENG